MRIYPSSKHEKLFLQFILLLKFHKTIYSLILPAPWWASLLVHLVSCSWAQILKPFLEEINFTCPAVCVFKTEHECGGSELHSVCNNPEKEDGDLPHFDYFPTQFSNQ